MDFSPCAPFLRRQGVTLLPEFIGKGSYGTVVAGTRGKMNVAIKFSRFGTYAQRDNFLTEMAVNAYLLQQEAPCNLALSTSMTQIGTSFYGVAVSPRFPTVLDRCYDTLQHDVRAQHTIAEQLIDSVIFLHSHAVAHNDLTGSNIGWDPATERVTLFDFGMATVGSARLIAEAWANAVGHVRDTIFVLSFNRMPDRFVRFFNSRLAPPTSLTGPLDGQHYVWLPDEINHRTRRHNYNNDVYACGVVMFLIVVGGFPHVPDWARSVPVARWFRDTLEAHVNGMAMPAYTLPRARILRTLFKQWLCLSQRSPWSIVDAKAGLLVFSSAISFESAVAAAEPSLHVDAQLESSTKLCSQ